MENMKEKIIIAITLFMVFVVVSVLFPTVGAALIAVGCLYAVSLWTILLLFFIFPDQFFVPLLFFYHPIVATKIIYTNIRGIVTRTKPWHLRACEDFRREELNKDEVIGDKTLLRFIKKNYKNYDYFKKNMDDYDSKEGYRKGDKEVITKIEKDLLRSHDIYL